jgi:hypothetical protein
MRFRCKVRWKVRSKWTRGASFGGRKFRLSGWPFSIRTPLGLHCSTIILRARRLGQDIRWAFRTDLATPGRFSRFRCWWRRVAPGRSLGFPVWQATPTICSTNAVDGKFPYLRQEMQPFRIWPARVIRTAKPPPFAKTSWDVSSTSRKLSVTP